ncbi:hypothetical protein NDU88_008281 [Pleurodeles waltl]|uniref:Uncharacterized protein n=1 Tax=Pleurodeles waltl TaxID=8319 RepID=A0AAV7VWW8_PLEWA|nr:hypothetical protein NDU88_008281 [Pleurodeles waltl]
MAAEPGPNRRGREWSGLTGDGAGPGGARWSEGVPRVCSGDPRCGPQRNTAARRRVELVGPDRRTIDTYGHSRGKENTGPNPLDT